MSVAAAQSDIAPSLRRLYIARFAFAILWAGATVAVASTLSPLAVALLVLYPAFDVVAAVLDARSGKAKAPAWLYVNMAVSVLAGLSLPLAASSGIPTVLRVWGAWAIAAGLVQLVVGVARRTLGGQWPMIVSGAISTLAGAAFILQAARPDPSLTGLAGYAVLGGVFFLVSAIRLGRRQS
ncbi:hypothetical protein [Fodinicola acaciae]|uniref:hypothetical protein n=1 Tax=Fodinicola acaciae TaxID=2681555 RepID=UPI0013D2E114|nr:hypothetical protein [Fodinicola acaciae]